MGQHPNGEKRITSRGTSSVASKTKQAKRERGRYEKGNHRYQVTRYYVGNLSEYTYREAIPYLEQANEEVELPRDHVPSYSTLSRWVKTYETVQDEKTAQRVSSTSWAISGRGGTASGFTPGSRTGCTTKCSRGRTRPCRSSTRLPPQRPRRTTGSRLRSGRFGGTWTRSRSSTDPPPSTAGTRC